MSQYKDRLLSPYRSDYAIHTFHHFSQDYTISHLLEKGASADKIVLGIPTYGRSYTLFNKDATELGSPADGPGVEGDATREKGYLAYYEVSLFYVNPGEDSRAAFSRAFAPRTFIV